MSKAFEAYKLTAAKLLRDPDDAEQLCHQHTILSTTPHQRSHLAIAQRCADLAPDAYIAVSNLGAAQMRAGLDSLATFQRALDLVSSEGRAAALHHVGKAHLDRGEPEAALSSYRASLAADPLEPKIRQSIAIAKLAAGNLQEGLFEFEVQHHILPRKAISKSGIKWWAGESLAGRRVILTHEQGFGDTLQFIRFAPLLRERCAHLVFSGPESLAPLIAEQFECFDDVINETGPFSADFVTSPMAACALLGIEYQDVAGFAYMRAEPLPLPVRGALKVGISWKGSPTYANDGLRSTSLESFCPLFELPGAAFYSLQTGPAVAEISRTGLDGFIADLGSNLKDWRDTARAIAAMDIVVSVDTAVGHLAGALGVPTLLLIGNAPCWRWLPGEKTAWYRNHALFRSWPMDAVRAELKRLIS